MDTQPTHQFHKATINDARQLVYLWGATFKQAYETVHSAENINTYCAQHYTLPIAKELLSNNDVICFFAIRKNNPVGFYILKHHPCPIPPNDTAAELKQIYILASEYGKGLGRTLFEHASDEARNARFHWLWLCVSDRNFRAQAFYKKLNFKPVAVGPILEVGTDRLSSTIMICNLNA